MISDFNIYTAVIGGILIGLASASHLVFQGRIAGVSGLFSHTISSKPQDWGSAGYFIVGLLIGGAVLLATNYPAFESSPLRPLWLYPVAGFIVGVGTRMGKGCTSGHGVCGIGRLSTRSIVATATFIAFAMLVVFFLRGIS